MIKSKKILSVITALAVMTGLFIGTTQVYATNPGVYTTSVKGHYANPVTGTIEDSGGESKKVMGQGMVDSTQYGQGLIEVDSSGQMYATIRLNTRNAISNPSFSINGAGVSSTEVQSNSGANTGDFRFPIPNLNVVVRAALHVIPMDRDVVYFITFSGTTPGSSDFVVNVKETEVEPKVEEKKEEKAEEKDTLKEPKSKAIAANKKMFESVKKNIEKEIKAIDKTDLSKKEKKEKKEALKKLISNIDAAQKASEEAINAAKDENAIKAATKTAKEEISKNEKSLKKITKVEKKEVKKEEKKDNTMLFVGLGVLALVVVGGAVFAFTKKKKEGNDNDKK